MVLNRDAILTANDLPIEEVDVPEWGGKLKVRGMTASQREAFESFMINQKSGSNIEGVRARLVVYSVLGQDNQPMFTEEDLPALSGKSAQVLDRIAEVAQRLSGLGKGAIEAAEKN